MFLCTFYNCKMVWFLLNYENVSVLWKNTLGENNQSNYDLKIYWYFQYLFRFIITAWNAQLKSLTLIAYLSQIILFFISTIEIWIESFEFWKNLGESAENLETDVVHSKGLGGISSLELHIIHQASSKSTTENWV